MCEIEMKSSRIVTWSAPSKTDGFFGPTIRHMEARHKVVDIPHQIGFDL